MILNGYIPILKKMKDLNNLLNYQKNTTYIGKTTVDVYSQKEAKKSKK